MAKSELIAGSKHGRYRNVPLNTIIAKTVQAVQLKMVDGECGSEPCIEIMFTDGTKYGFVIPGDTK